MRGLRENIILNFSKYIYLLEAKVDDLVEKYPDYADAIQVYNKVDPTPTKKFLRWLVKQHISGNVTPEDARLHPTLSNFDRYSHKLESKDHNSYNYNQLADAIGTHIQNKIEADQKRKAVETLYTDPTKTITAQHIKTREAAQKLYGGGKARCGEDGGAQGTSWCVAARGDNNMFGRYGPAMYTIHAKGDENAPYAVHPFTRTGPIITNRHNKGDLPPTIALNKTAHIEKAYNAIIDHSGKNLWDLIRKSHPDKMEQFVHHPLINLEQLQHIQRHGGVEARKAIAKHTQHAQILSNALDDADPQVGRIAATRQDLPSELLHKASRHNNETVQTSVLGRPDLNDEHLKNLLGSKHFDVAVQALAHPNMSAGLRKVADTYISNTSSKMLSASINNMTKENLHDYIKFVSTGNVKAKHLKLMVNTAISSPNSVLDNTHIDKILDLQSKGKSDTDQDLYDIKKMVVGLPFASKNNLSKAISTDFNPNSELINIAFKHPNFDPGLHISDALKHSPPSDLGNSQRIGAVGRSILIKRAALEHPLHRREHVEQGLRDPQYQVRIAALNSPHATFSDHLHAFANDISAPVREHSFDYLTKNDSTNISKYVGDALGSDLNSLRNHVLAGPYATIEQHKHTLKNDPWVWNRLVSFNHLVKNDPSNIDTYLDTALKDKPIALHAAASEHLRGKKLEDIISNGPDDVASTALEKNPNVEEEHLLSAVNRPHTSGSIAASALNPAKLAIKHKKATLAVLQAGLSHSHPAVQKAAQGKLNRLAKIK